MSSADLLGRGFIRASLGALRLASRPARLRSVVLSLGLLALPLACSSCEPPTVHPVGLELAASCPLPKADRLELICPSAVSLEVRDEAGETLKSACADLPPPPLLLSSVSQAIPQFELGDIERGEIALAIVSPGSEAAGCPPARLSSGVVLWGSDDFDLASDEAPVIRLSCSPSAFEDPTCKGTCDDEHQDCGGAIGDGCLSEYNSCTLICAGNDGCLVGCNAERDLCLENCDIERDECKTACEACVRVQ